jgi:serine protease
MSIGTDLVNCVPNPPKPNQEGCNNPAIDDAVNAAASAPLNIPIAVSAGNDNTDACRVAPASASLSFTVASSTSTDQKSGFSNHGKCVQIVAPGSGITSTWLNLSTNTISGTSMAAPHVAGVMSVLLSGKSYESVQDVYKALTDSATDGAINGLPENTVNKLLYVQ